MVHSAASTAATVIAYSRGRHLFPFERLVVDAIVHVEGRQTGDNAADFLSLP
jgi:hypothetical protein